MKGIGVWSCLCYEAAPFFGRGECGGLHHQVYQTPYQENQEEPICLCVRVCVWCPFPLLAITHPLEAHSTVGVGLGHLVWVTETFLVHTPYQVVW